MRLDTEVGIIELVDEPLDRTDHLQKYPFVKELAPRYRSNSIHGLTLNGEPIAVFMNAGGGARVSAHSAVYVDGLLYVVVGNGVVCVRPRPFEYKWSLEVDWSTCEGVYFDTDHQALIAHGESEITRISKAGTLLWSTSGADIFTGGFSLLPEFIEAIDFNGRKYRLRYDDGQEIS